MIDVGWISTATVYLDLSADILNDAFPDMMLGIG
jgi:hypothetical protein